MNTRATESPSSSPEPVVVGAGEVAAPDEPLGKVFVEYTADTKGSISGFKPKQKVLAVTISKNVSVQRPADAIIGGGKVRKSLLLVWTEDAPP